MPLVPAVSLCAALLRPAHCPPTLQHPHSRQASHPFPRMLFFEGSQWPPHSPVPCSAPVTVPGLSPPPCPSPASSTRQVLCAPGPLPPHSQPWASPWVPKHMTQGPPSPQAPLVPLLSPWITASVINRLLTLLTSSAKTFPLDSGPLSQFDVPLCLLLHLEFAMSRQPLSSSQPVPVRSPHLW